jgi:predicted nucleic acid-binding protein
MNPETDWLSSIPYSRVEYLDACAAVKLVITELGSDQLKAHFSNHSFSITSFCFFEALGVLKRKMVNGEIPRDQYFFACYMLITYAETQRIRIDHEPRINDVRTFMTARKFAKDHDLDLYDALQLVSVKHGKFCNLVK